MKQKVTRAKKANRYFPKSWGGIYSMSVFARRVEGYLGADYKAFDMKHPSLASAVEGYKARLAQARSEKAARRRAHERAQEKSRETA